MPKPQNSDVVAATGLGATPSPDTTHDTPMDEKQAAILRELCAEKGEPFDGNLTAEQAEERIAALRD